MAYLLKFDPDNGSAYTFPDTFYPADRSLSNVVPVAKLARTNGARVLTGTKGERRLTIRGGFVGPDEPLGGVTSFQGQIDDLLEALSAGPGDLYFGEDDYRFRCCQWEHEGESYDASYWRRILLAGEIVFVAGDPYRYKIPIAPVEADPEADPPVEAVEGDDWSDTWTAPSTGDTHTVTIGGKAKAAPTISIAVGGSGPQAIAYTLTNTTTGESFTLAGNVTGGNVIVLDSLPPKSVMIGSLDRRTLYEGQFIHLKPGAGGNDFEIAIDAGSIDSILFEWLERYN